VALKNERVTIAGAEFALKISGLWRSAGADIAWRGWELNMKYAFSYESIFMVVRTDQPWQQGVWETNHMNNCLKWSNHNSQKQSRYSGIRTVFRNRQLLEGNSLIRDFDIRGLHAVELISLKSSFATTRVAWI
jgi:hypothetical protein